MTITGIILIPLCLIAILAPWRWSVMLLPSMTLLVSAAVIAFGSFGLQPGYFMAMLMTGRWLIEVLFYGRPLPSEMKTGMRPLLAFCLCALFSLWVGLFFFQGKISVIGGTDGFQLSLAAPYYFRRENITQAVYLLIGVGFVAALICEACWMGPAEFIKAADRGIIASIIISNGFCVWHLLNYLTGLWFPEEFLFSNPGYFTARDQSILDTIRLNGCFSEPSALAFQYAGFLFYSWRRYILEGSVAAMLLVMSCVLFLFMSLSTTGLLVIGLFGVLVGMNALFRLVQVRPRSPEEKARKAVQWKARMAGGGLFILGVGFLTSYAVTNKDFVTDMMNTLVYEKKDSSSFDERNSTNLMALDITVDTGGIGIGLGSHKPSSLPLTLLSNTGLAGSFAFAFFLFRILLPGRIRRPPDVGISPDAGAPLRWFVLGVMMIHAFSNPNLSTAVTWMICGFALGWDASLRRSARLARSGQTASVQADPVQGNGNQPQPPAPLPRRASWSWPPAESLLITRRGQA